MGSMCAGTLVVACVRPEAEALVEAVLRCRRCGCACQCPDEIIYSPSETPDTSPRTPVEPPSDPLDRPRYQVYDCGLTRSVLG